MIQYDWSAMYVAARAWEIQPSEFWNMTVSEWMAEAEWRARQTPEGRAMLNRDKWKAEAAMTDEEWWAIHGNSTN